MIDLKEKDRRLICVLAEECFNSPLEIWAYGSRVNGDGHEASDLDLVIRSANLHALDGDELLDFREKLQDSSIPILVQAFDWAKLPQSFHSNILKKYHVLYSTFEKFQAD